MSGLVFISHATEDRADVNALVGALRQGFNDRLRTFNTSSGGALSPGENWRRELLAALDNASVVLFWATSSALRSKEVAFEIGAASATQRYIIPCCVHIPPGALPWGLNHLQALMLDTENGWVQLAERIAEVIDFPGGLELDPLRELSRRFEAPDDALGAEVLGYTIDLKNRSKSQIDDISLTSADGEPLPVWATELDVVSLAPGESVVMFRDRSEEARELTLSWSDVTGATRQRRVTIPPAVISGE